MATPSPSAKWLPLADKKFKRGYVLVIHEQRRIANFFKPGKGYEPCPYRIAQDMILEGLITETGKRRPLGLEYTRVTTAQLRAISPSVDDDDDDLESGVAPMLDADDDLEELTSDEALD